MANASLTAGRSAATSGMQSTVLLVARLLMASLFLVAGVRKLLAFAGTAGYFTKLGLPAPELMVVLAILIELGAGVMLVIGWRARLAAWLLLLFTLVATFAGHRFWEFEAAQFVNQLNHFLKNLAVMGGLMFVAVFGPGSASLDRQ